MIIQIAVYYYMLVTAIIRKKLNEANQQFKFLFDHPEMIHMLKSVQKHHLKCLQMIEAAEEFFKLYIFCVYSVIIPTIFLLFCNIVVAEHSKYNYIMYFHMLMCCVIVMVVTLEAAGLSSKAHHLEYILREVPVLEIPKRQIFQINTSLERVKGTRIGYSCLGIFVVSSNTLIEVQYETIFKYTITVNIISGLMTYILMYMQMRQKTKQRNSSTVSTTSN
ncbi:uncharacterized protein LOC111614196 [Centruroides sculpturatus]|uniref:uncharacterized protein LOC111614196 n=1 Tax=Centruroides sculpturatus TaxID=218467 RepID=UPI000C6E1624|nr:uncharacterized protein LOC111614196 [Centruroides sculpturatus]